MVDCIIIGSGVAGISSALTLQSNKKSFLLFGNAGLSEKISKAERIKNYPGLSNVTGEEFVSALCNQLSEAGISIIEEKVSGVYALGEKFGVNFILSVSCDESELDESLKSKVIVSL